MIRQYDGFYFVATGVSSHEFFEGHRSVCRVCRESAPWLPVRIHTDCIEWTLDPSLQASAGTMVPLLDQDSTRERAWIYLWGYGRFSVAIRGAALEGRVLDGRDTDSGDAEFVYCMDGGEVMRIRKERGSPRRQYGEWFPRRYVADVDDALDEELVALALSAPFLGLRGVRFD